MATTEERLEEATAKAENASQIMHDFANGAEDAVVQTAAGSIPTLQNWLKQVEDGLRVSLDGGSF